MKILLEVWEFIKALILAFTVQPAYDVDPKTLPMNLEQPEAPAEVPIVLTAREELLKLAKEWYGKELSPLDPVDDNVACVDSLTNLIRLKFPDFPKVYSTANLHHELVQSVNFRGTLDAKAGNIILNVTGTGNGSIRGHCGVIGETKVYANNSLTGLWDDYYDLKTWNARYRHKGGMMTRVYEAI